MINLQYKMGDVIGTSYHVAWDNFLVAALIAGQGV